MLTSTIFGQQILSPVAAYLEQAKERLRLDDWQITDDTDCGYQANFRVSEVSDYGDLTSLLEPLVSLQLTNASTIVANGSSIQPHFIRLLAVATTAQIAATNRDICAAFIEYGLSSNELTFPGVSALDDMTIISRSPITTTSKGTIFLASTIIRLSFSIDH